MRNLLNIKTRQEFRDWLEQNHNKETECWVVLQKGKPTDYGLWYLDFVEEALCFGWIDSVHKNIDGFGHAQKFSPRTSKSPWSELNKERVRRLERLGLMTNAGRKVLPDMNAPFVIDEDILELINSDKTLHDNFYSFPELYQRIRLNSIQRERKKPEVFERMKKTFVEKTRQGKMYGSWNDYGRLN